MNFQCECPDVQDGFRKGRGTRGQLTTIVGSLKRQKDRKLKDELPRLLGAQYATGEQFRNNSRENEETEPKQKQHPVVDVTGNGSKVQCYKEHYCLGTWNIRSMNQGIIKGLYY